MLKSDIINLIKFFIKTDKYIETDKKTLVKIDLLIEILVQLYKDNNHLKNDIINFLDYLNEKIKPDINFHLLFYELSNRNPNDTNN